MSVLISMLSAYYLTAYTSDDVVWQNGLLKWVPFSGDVFYGDVDVGFVLQAPIYWLVSHFIVPGRPAMFMSGLILSLINFTLVYFCSLYIMKISDIKVSLATLLPILWVSTFGYALSWIFLGTNLHNLVVGLIFLLLVVTIKVCRGELTLKRKTFLFVGSMIFVVLLALFIVNDRYFVYFGVLPTIFLVVIYAFKKSISIQKAIVLVSLIIIGYFVSHLVVRMLSHAGLVLLPGVGPPTVVEFQSLASNLMNTIHSYLYIMGGDFFGQKILSLNLIVAAANSILAVYLLYVSSKIIRKRNLDKPEIFILALILFAVLIAHIFSTINYGQIQTYRYLVIIPFIAPIILAFAINHQDTRYALNKFLTIMIFVILLNLTFSLVGLFSNGTVAKSIPEPIRNTQQTQNYKLIDMLRKNNLRKGYAEYWSANINTYLSKGNVSVLPIKCEAKKTAPDIWFINKNRILEKTKASFVMINRNRDGSPTCEQQDIIEQFGKPMKIINFEDEKIIFLYNYDLIEKMDLSALKM